MASNYSRLLALMRDGFEVVDITSDALAIEARLTRADDGDRVVRLTRADAVRILFEDSGERERSSRRSRFLVTRPLR